MSTVSTFLRRVLLADAATCVASGLLMTLGAQPLEPLLGLPATLLRLSGVALLPFAAFVIYLATREHLHRRSIFAVILLNLLWVVNSVAILLAGWFDPTHFGVAFVVLQALAVAAFAELEWSGLRRVAATA